MHLLRRAMCTGGSCVDIPPMPDAGPVDSGAVDAAIDVATSDVGADATVDAMVDASSADVVREAGTGADARVDAGGGTTASNCGCTVPGGPTSGSWFGVIAGLMAAATVRRHRSWAPRS